MRRGPTERDGRRWRVESQRLMACLRGPQSGGGGGVNSAEDEGGEGGGTHDSSKKKEKHKKTQQLDAQEAQHVVDRVQLED